MSLVKYEKKGKIAYITLNRPDKLNSLNPELTNELANAWIDFRDDDNLWVAILSGEGRAFCAGADFTTLGTLSSYPILSEPHSPTPVSSSPALLSSPNRYGLTKPVIGALHGYVLGGGLWLALETDIKIATGDAVFGFPEVKFGNAIKCTLPFLYYTFPALAYELMFIGDRITAQRAYEGGLINNIVSTHEDLMPAATAMAERICENSPMAVRAMKEAIIRWRASSFQSMNTFMEYVCRSSWESEDFEEGRRAFLEKRKPVWKGK